LLFWEGRGVFLAKKGAGRRYGAAKGGSAVFSGPKTGFFRLSRRPLFPVSYIYVGKNGNSYIFVER
jgi:hypothetical protein